MSRAATPEVTRQLDRLADQAPTASGDPAALWSRGRRRQRSRWAGVGGALALVATLGTLAAAPVLDRTQQPIANSPEQGLVLPDVIREPSGWTGSFPAAPGPLMAVGAGTKAVLLSAHDAWWGVSGVTGESRFLDLPDAAAGAGEVALSADGTRLAYWITGPTTEAPLRTDGEDPMVGVAVLDLPTGDVSRWDTESTRGMMTEGLAWAGDVLWWSAGDYLEGSTPTARGAHVDMHTWDLSTDERVELARGTAGSNMLLSAALPGPDGFLVGARPGRLLQVRGAGVEGTIRTDANLVGSNNGGIALSPAGTQIAGLRARDNGHFSDKPLPLMVGRTGSQEVSLTRVGDAASWTFFGWRSENQVVIGTPHEDVDQPRYTASAIDVDTAEVIPLLDFVGNVPTTFASDAWMAPVIDAPEPPWAPDPRVLGLGLAGLVYAGLILWRRVRRR